MGLDCTVWYTMVRALRVPCGQVPTICIPVEVARTYAAGRPQVAFVLRCVSRVNLQVPWVRPGRNGNLFKLYLPEL